MTFKPQITSTNQLVQKEALFRFGDPFGYKEIETAIQRNPFITFLTTQAPQDALSKGFELVKLGTDEVLESSDIVENVVMKHQFNILKAVSNEIAYGQSLLAMSSDDDMSLVLLAHDIDEYEVERDEAGKLIKFATQKYIYGVAGNNLRKTDYEGEQLINVFEILTRPGKDIGTSLSYLEPIWDLCYGLNILAAQATYLAVRAGAGLVVFRVPKGQLNNSDVSEELYNIARNMQSSSSIMMLPQPDSNAEAPIEFDLKTVDGGIDFNGLLETMLTYYSVYTGYPMAVVRGLIPGELAAGEINEKLKFEVVRRLQENYTPTYEWVIDSLISHEKIEGVSELEDYEIRWRNRPVLTDEQAATLMAMQVKNASDLKSLGVKREAAIELAGLKIEASQIESEEEIQARMPNFGDNNDTEVQEEENEDSPSDEREEDADNDE